MSLFTDLFIISLLTPVTNYVNRKKCMVLEHYNPEDRKAYAKHWLKQTQVYGKAVREYLDEEDATADVDTALKLILNV